MNISEILARDAEDAWIEKYRKALEAAPIVPTPKPVLGETLVRISKSLTSNVRRVRDWLQERRLRSLKPRIQIGNPAVLHTAIPPSRKVTALTSEADRTQMAS